MSFYQEFIEQSESDYARLRRFEANLAQPNVQFEYNKQLRRIAAISSEIASEIDGQLVGMHDSILHFYHLSQSMRHAKIIRIGGKQCAMFLEAQRLEGQDYNKWLRLPFPGVWLALDEPFSFVSVNSTGGYHEGMLSGWLPSVSDDMPAKVRGVLLTELHRESFAPKSRDTFNDSPGIDTLADQNMLRFKDGRAIPMDQVDRLIAAHFISPIPETKFNEDSAVIAIMKDGTIEYSKNDDYKARREMMITFIIHVTNFLSSPSVKLMPAQASDALQKKRVRSGKEPLPGWYEITYRKQLNDYSKAKVSATQYHHSFRYDVRGHWMMFRRGPMAGRAIWCPDHQRGLANKLYRPKSYRVPGEKMEAETLWKG